MVVFFTVKKRILIYMAGLILLGTGFSLGFDSRKAVSNGYRVRIRSSATIDSQILGYLAKGEAVTVIQKTTNTSLLDGDENYWYEIVNAEGIQGWVFGSFLQVDQNSGSRKIREDRPKPLATQRNEYVRDTAQFKNAAGNSLSKGEREALLIAQEQLQKKFKRPVRANYSIAASNAGYQVNVTHIQTKTPAGKWVDQREGFGEIYLSPECRVLRVSLGP
jgi:uncharacterized protein YgiM (DUF1202 family)